MSTEENQPTQTETVPPPNSTDSIATNSSSQVDVEPLHHPQEMAHVEVPHNVENIPQGVSSMTGKSLLAKKMAANGAFYSPSDALVSPCTQKLSSQKGKRWANAKVKPTAFGKSNLNQSSLGSGLDAPVEEAKKEPLSTCDANGQAEQTEASEVTTSSNANPAPEPVSAAT